MDERLHDARPDPATGIDSCLTPCVRGHGMAQFFFLTDLDV